MSFLSVKKGKAGCSASKALPFLFALPCRPASNRWYFIFLSLLLMITAFRGAVIAGAQSPLPVIPRLDSRDLLFRQFSADVEAARIALFSGNRLTTDAALPTSLPADALAASLTIYSYTVREDDGLLGIAARCNIPYAALSSLNRLSNIEDLTAGKNILLPSMPGIFVPETPLSDLERLLSSTRGTEGILLSVPRDGITETFRFFPGDDFTPTERIFFLNRGFRFPLRDYQVTSLYGPRINPVTGRDGVHRGIDLAAPLGTEVYAARSGTVTLTGEDNILGKYIIISHENNWLSLYGHLSSIDTALHSVVQSGSLIGKVGTTGQSTGPHLHFEIIRNGQNQDPARLLGIFRGTTGQ